MTAARSGPPRPDVVVAGGVADVVDAVRRADRLGVRLAVRGRGEPGGDDVLVVDLSRLAAIAVDAEAQVATVGGGATWSAVLAAAHPHGLAPVPGDDVDAGVAATFLDGSPGWLARAHGLPGNALREAEVVTRSGIVVPSTAIDRGIVTAVTLDLVPLAEVYAGDLRYPAAMAPEVGARFAEWSAALPPAMTSALVLAGAEVAVRACHAGPPAEGRDLVDAWRRWATPTSDRFAVRPTTELGVLDEPPAARSAPLATEWLRDLGDPVVDALGVAVWPPEPSPIALRAEVRHLAGLATPTDLLLRIGGATPTAEAAAAAARRLGDLRRALTAVTALGVTTGATPAR